MCLSRCPGGQIVPTALDKEHLCVNGMSYSNRGSKWANSAVVVSVGEAYGDFPEGAAGTQDAYAAAWSAFDPRVSK